MQHDVLTLHNFRPGKREKLLEYSAFPAGIPLGSGKSGRIKFFPDFSGVIPVIIAPANPPPQHEIVVPSVIPLVPDFPPFIPAFPRESWIKFWQDSLCEPKIPAAWMPQSRFSRFGGSSVRQAGAKQRNFWNAARNQEREVALLAGKIGKCEWRDAGIDGISSGKC